VERRYRVGWTEVRKTIETPLSGAGAGALLGGIFGGGKGAGHRFRNRRRPAGWEHHSFFSFFHGRQKITRLTAVRKCFESAVIGQ